MNEKESMENDTQKAKVVRRFRSLITEHVEF